MRILQLVSIGLLLLASCCTINVERPRGIEGVDPAAQPYLNEFKAMAKASGVTFKKNVPIGFGKIMQKGVVAECFMGENTREVIVSSVYWDQVSKAARLEVMLHELTHCYCGRYHTYKGVEYPHYDTSRVAFYGNGQSDAEKMFYPEDGCPKSMMFPVVLDDECTLAHYSDYTKELFEDCDAW